MEFTWKTANGNFKDVSVELDSEVMELSGNTENYCEVYKELAELVGESGAKKIWTHYRGLSIQFPQRLYSKEYTRQFIGENLDTMKPKEMAKLLSLTERRVRQIVKEMKEEKNYDKSAQNSNENVSNNGVYNIPKQKFRIRHLIKYGSRLCKIFKEIY